MAWQRNYVVLTTGERVRYALIERPDSDAYYVRYRTADGRRAAKSTGRAKKPDAVEAAHQIILEDYGQIAPTSEKVTWAVAVESLRDAMAADGKRPRTVQGYVETLGKLTSMFPLARGPADVTSRMASDFKGRYAAGRFSRRKVQKGAPTHARKTKSLDSRIRTLKAAFGWFVSLRLLDVNPFENVTAPELDRHEVKYVRESDVSEFFTWLDKRWPGWDLPRLFFSVKAVTGCRLEDICSLRSSQLQDGRLVFTADTTKNRGEHYAVLPADLYAELEGVRGGTFLWESYPLGLKEANRVRGVPCHRLNAKFSPRRIYLWVTQLMRAYQEESGKHLSSHDFRRAAFTRAAEEDVHPKRAAVAFDVTPETMMKYYTATEKKETSDEVLGGLAGRLLPKKKEPKPEEGL